jgi:hypothetical protein
MEEIYERASRALSRPAHTAQHTKNLGAGEELGDGELIGLHRAISPSSREISDYKAFSESVQRRFMVFN